MINVGVVFGGQSPEHEVSVITSIQVAAVLDREKYRPIPIYVGKDGLWYTGNDLLDIKAYSNLDGLLARSDLLRIQPSSGKRMRLQSTSRDNMFGACVQILEIDIFFIGMHGGSGENGGLQGLFESMNVPYTGSGVLASSLAMDKARSKIFCRAHDIPVVSFQTVRESAWARLEDKTLEQLEARFGYPLVVKPVSLGSSIGISLVSNQAELEEAVEEAFRYDETIIVEHAVANLREINCSILGSEDQAVASVLEEPVSSSEMLSYEEKYMRHGGSGNTKGRPGGSKSRGPEGMASQGRIIPAPLSDEETSAIKALALKIFKVLGCAGVARIDFLMDAETGDVFFNEINTIPGSLSFYLWEPSGIPFSELVQQLIEAGFERYAQRTNRIRTYNVNLLAEHSSRGLKGAKS